MTDNGRLCIRLGCQGHQASALTAAVWLRFVHLGCVRPPVAEAVWTVFSYVGCRAGDDQVPLFEPTRLSHALTTLSFPPLARSPKSPPPEPLAFAGCHYEAITVYLVFLREIECY
jgi:hypothetical protein